jgi:hypothetical protein
MVGNGSSETRSIDRHDEDRETLVLGGIGVGPGGQPHVVGVLDRAGEDLLAVDHVLVAVAHGPRLERGQDRCPPTARCSRWRNGPRPWRMPGRIRCFCSLGAEGHKGRTHAVQGEERGAAHRPSGTPPRRSSGRWARGPDPRTPRANRGPASRPGPSGGCTGCRSARSGPSPPHLPPALRSTPGAGAAGPAVLP